MPEEDKGTANQTPGGGARDDTANQTPGGSAQDTVINAQGDAEPIKENESEGLKQGLIAEQKKRQAAEQQARALAEQLNAIQQQLIQSAASGQNQRDPNDLITYADLQQQLNHNMQALHFQNLRSQLTDLDDLVGNNPGSMNYQPSEYVKKIIQANPSLASLPQFIAQGNPQALSLTYQYAKMQKELDDLRAIKQATQELQNLNKANDLTSVMSPAAAGGMGGAALDQQIPDISSSPQDFDNFYERVKAGEFNKGA